MAIKILTDSVADIPEGIVKELNIKVMPLTVNFEDGSYKDGIEITKEKFYKKLLNSKKLPTTSQITPGEFIEVFEELTKNGDEIIVILMSSCLSGTYNSAVNAKEYLQSERITVIDSKLVTFSQGLVVVEAARMAAKGYHKSEIIDRVYYMIENLECKFIIGDIEYLKKGGRLTPSQALIGKLLNIKPILTMKDGKLIYDDKVRGKKKAIKWVINWIFENNYNLEEKTVGLFHSDNYEFLMELRKELESNFDIKEIIEAKVGAVVGTHAGPGCIAIAFIKDNHIK
ncbi:DegV family protein [Paramaledivibacter caminithermalis]|jgi:DegV family protein with EDD domain|uniref:EDD domain protein, DegV family n=1 Tax=Paramaledivibacter caminithermalis (strain DSM 15212 / CIP 107654 / DViRD3) TaxID=1121301 RepID=A0A1M6MK07_PARC5|nr:DegV family protein [Paramaledivibacter caminithermalis]SHJ83812.1 EDD domain protein, DegV family [Paramaledivibacter caminithermalis DSM 15212]